MSLASGSKPDREASAGRGDAARGIHGANGQLSLCGGPHDRIHFAFHDAARIHLEGDLRLLARLDLADFVLMVNGENPLLILDEIHRGRHRQRNGHRARPQRQSHDGAIGGRMIGGLAEFPFASASCARPGDLGFDLGDFVLLAFGRLAASFSRACASVATVDAVGLRGFAHPPAACS